MDLRELRTFVAVIEEGCFSGVAQRMNLSQPTISCTIRSLEKHCGVQLLARTSAGVVMTTAGRLLLAEARAVLAPHEQAVAAMSGGCDERQSLWIGIPSGRESESCWSRIRRPSAPAEVYEGTRNVLYTNVFGPCDMRHPWACGVGGVIACI
jgi:DNA-binding transcriptional LysR family regulator